MNSPEETIEAIGISCIVAIFLLNTGRALKAIELSKESLVLLNSEALRKKQQFRKLFHGGICRTMFDAYCVVHDNKNVIKYGRKLLVIYREYGEKDLEGWLCIVLAQTYESQTKYVEAKELFKRAITIMRETGDKRRQAIACGNLGAVYLYLGKYVKAKKYFEKALVIDMEIGDRKGEAILCGNIGEVLQYLGDYVKAKQYQEKALAISMETGDRAGEATAYSLLGTLFRSLGEYAKAKNFLEKSLEINVEIGNRALQAANYGNLGNVFQSLSEYVKADECFEKALVIIMEIGDRNGEAAVYGNKAVLFESLGDYVKAIEFSEKSLEINLEIGARAGEATNYGSLGNVFRSLGNHVKAKEYLEKALVIKTAIGDRKGEATYYGYLGQVFKSLGDYAKAKEHYEKALAINLEIGDRGGEATTYGNLANVFESLGEYVKAKEYLDKSLVIRMEIGDRSGKATCYGNLGYVFQILGEYVKAKEFYNEALAISMEIGQRAGAATYIGNIGTVLRSLGDYGKANEYLEKALAIHMDIGDRNGEAVNYGNLGTLFETLGDNVKAKEYYQKALAITIEIGDRQLEALNNLNLGGVYYLLGEYIIAEEYVEKALLLSKDIRDGETEYRCYCLLTITKLSQEQFKEAFFYLFQSVEKCEDLRGLNADDDQIKICFADIHAFPYKRLSRLLCENGDHNSALHVVELGRARALADLMATQYSAEKHISTNPQSWTGIENVITKESKCTCLYICYHVQRVFLWILKTNGVISFREVEVDDNTLYKRLAEPAKHLDEFFAILAKSFRSFGILPEEVCEDRSLIGNEPIQSHFSREEKYTTLRQANYEKNPESSLTLFYEMLISPVSDILEEPEIIIVPDRNLYRVPFAALLDENGKYLSETFKIRIVPSLTTLKLIQDSPADFHSQTGALIVGDPLNKNFPPLPGARKEAEMIGRQLGVQPLLGKEATKQTVLQRIDLVSLIHFAAHGNAEKGEIALALPGSTNGILQENDYLLKMSDISQVQLRAKLVVLSCCHSGRGQIKAEGVVGIARAFLGSGARSVLVALWALDDIATKQFMSRFYEHLVCGESASESLHKSMKWMRDNGFTKVSEWAPFMLIGDNVTIDFGK